MKRLATIVFLTALLLLPVSCSVKEDRAECPCYLDVFWKGALKGPRALLGYSPSGERLFSCEAKEDEGSLEVRVPKGMVRLSSYLRLSGIQPDGTDVLIEKGCQADSLYACISRVDCSGECARDSLTLHKQFSTVYLSLTNPARSLEGLYSLRVRGSVHGMDLLSLSPLEGEFEFLPAERDGALFVFRVPRQRDDSLVIDIIENDGGSTVGSIDAGRMIRSSGFDWGAEDLDDIIVSVTFGSLSLEVSVIEWDAERSYDITI